MHRDGMSSSFYVIIFLRLGLFSFLCYGMESEESLTEKEKRLSDSSNSPPCQTQLRAM